MSTNTDTIEMSAAEIQRFARAVASGLPKAFCSDDLHHVVEAVYVVNAVVTKLMKEGVGIITPKLIMDRLTRDLGPEPDPWAVDTFEAVAIGTLAGLRWPLPE